jgi:hypothetical protein
MYAYLGINSGGDYQLFVSLVELNPAGTRLEKGKHHRLPENVRLAAQAPNDPQLAIAGLISLRNFLAGEEHGTESLEFGRDELPLQRKRK